MKTINWRKVGTGIYESKDRAFRCTYNESTNRWQLLQLDDENKWQRCQSYGSLRDAKIGAETRVRVHDAFTAWIAAQE